MTKNKEAEVEEFNGAYTNRSWMFQARQNQAGKRAEKLNDVHKMAQAPSAALHADFTFDKVIEQPYLW